MIRRYFLWCVLAAFPVGFSACVSFRIPPLPAPENFIESGETCKGIEFSGDLLDPVGRSAVFSPDEDILFYVRLRNVTRRILLRWKWYAPDQTLTRDAGNVEVNADLKFLDVVTAYDRLRPGPSGTKEGEWTVCLLVNDTAVEVKKFNVQAKNANEKR
jgi:hypothetical protein